MALKTHRSLILTFLALSWLGAGAHAQEAKTAPAAVIAAPSQEVQTALPAAAEKEAAPEAKDEESPDKIKLNALLNEIKACADMKERIMRVRCYDDLATAQGLMSPEEQKLEREKLAAYGLWQVLSEFDQLGIETLYITQHPYNKLSRSQQINLPTLNIRCRQGNTDVYLDWKSQLNGNQMIIQEIYIFTRMDNTPEVQNVWQLSLDSYAAFSKAPIEFVKSMRDKRKLQLRVTPHGAATETLMFELGMLDQALDILVKRCYGPAPADAPKAGQ